MNVGLDRSNVLPLALAAREYHLPAPSPCFAYLELRSSLGVKQRDQFEVYKLGAQFELTYGRQIRHLRR